jgi:hypothetical protein
MASWHLRVSKDGCGGDAGDLMIGQPGQQICAKAAHFEKNADLVLFGRQNVVKTKFWAEKRNAPKIWLS